MKTKIALLAVAVAFALTAAAPSAHAGDLAKAKKISDRMMTHIAHMATVLDANVKTPDKAVNQITAYFAHKKRVAEFKVIAAQAKGLTLSTADKAALKKHLAGAKAIKAITMSFKNFAKVNPAAVQKLFGVIMKLQNMMPK